MLGIVGNYVYTGKYVRKQNALSVRVLTEPPKEACYQIFAVIASIAPALPFSPKLYAKAVEHIMTYILAKFGGRPTEAALAIELAKTAVMEMGSSSRASAEAIAKAIESMAASQRGNARALVAPIGETCSTLIVGNPDTASLVVDKSVRDAIYENDPIEITDAKPYEVKISEIDIVRKTCKVSFIDDDQSDRRFDGIITDPTIGLPNNKYVNALALINPIKVIAKAQLKNGELHKLYISDIAP